MCPPQLTHAAQGLDSAGSDMSLFEHRLLVIRQELQSSAQLAMTKGGMPSLEPLAVESELREAQLRSGELQKKRKALLETIDQLLRKDPFKQHALPSTPRQEKPPIKPNPSYNKMKVKKNDAPMNKAQSLEECLAVLDSLQAEMNLQPNSLEEKVKEESPDADDTKYLELIDLLTNKMFETDVQPTKEKKSNSLPRSGTALPEPRLRKSSSQVFSPSKVGRPMSQLSAYERLFGVQSPSNSRCTSPSVKKNVPMIIGKAKRPGRLSGSPARSEENVSILPSSITNATSEEKKKEKISLSSIDSILAAPGKIDIPARYQPETDKTQPSTSEDESRKAKAANIKRMLLETGSSCTLPSVGTPHNIKSD